MRSPISHPVLEILGGDNDCEGDDLFIHEPRSVSEENIVAGLEFVRFDIELRRWEEKNPVLHVLALALGTTFDIEFRLDALYRFLEEISGGDIATASKLGCVFSLRS